MSIPPPRSTKELEGVAEAFCAQYCRQPDDTCPFGWTRGRCPLWQFVEADLPTDTRLQSMIVDEEPALHPHVCQAPLRMQVRCSGSPQTIDGDFDPDEGYEWPDTDQPARRSST